eukprot:NODE_283_length_11832_cov_0.293190.p4 type:complete len:226 gc:universal NODE_283_length_11832_cov_0.293190:9320-9997(+)
MENLNQLSHPSSNQPAGSGLQQQIPNQQMIHPQMLTQQIVSNFWSSVIFEIEHGNMDFKLHAFPLARVKRVMKLDDDLKLMISSEGPMLFAKACEIFIAELTTRAWMHAEENKRRTLQRSDISSAISKSDQYDFLIDIVPRDDIKGFQVMKEEGFYGQQAAPATQFPFLPPNQANPQQQQYGYYWDQQQQSQPPLQSNPYSISGPPPPADDQYFVASESDQTSDK